MNSSRNPMPPSDLLLQISNSASVEDFVSSFGHVREEVAKYLVRAGHKLESFDSILDFGCGVGRFAYAVAPVLRANQKLYGCDLDERCADWSSNMDGYAEVVQNGLSPPLPWNDGKFDFIYALSVFTHLSLEHQFNWAWEMCRLLKPGGILLCSTHGLGQLLPGLMNGENWRDKKVYMLGSDGMVAILSTNATRAIQGQREVAAFHDRQALLAQFYPLRMKLHVPVSSMAGCQSISVLMKSENLPSHAVVPVQRFTSTSGVFELKETKPAETLELRIFFAPETTHYNVADYRLVTEWGTGKKRGIKTSQLEGLDALQGQHHCVDIRLSLEHYIEYPLSISIKKPSGTTVLGNWFSPHWVSSSS